MRSQRDNLSEVIAHAADLRAARASSMRFCKEIVATAIMVVAIVAVGYVVLVAILLITEGWPV